MSAQPLPTAAGIQPAQFENPMGIDGFEFVEFASPEPAKAARAVPQARLHRRSRGTRRGRSTTIARTTATFLINEDPDSFAADFAAEHGPSACGFAIRVNKLAEWVRVQALKNGAKSIANKETSKAVAAPVIEGIGGCMLYIVDRYDDKGTIYDPDCEWLPGATDDAEGFRPHLHRPPHAQPLLRQHGEVGGLLRAPVQLPRDPLLRHQGRQDRPAVQGDDRAGRHGAHPAQRIARSEEPDQRIPRRSTRARASSTSPASPTTSTRRWRRCARRASSSWIRRTPISS